MFATLGFFISFIFTVGTRSTMPQTALHGIEALQESEREREREGRYRFALNDAEARAAVSSPRAVTSESLALDVSK